MLTLKLLRERPDFVVERLAVKNFEAKSIVDEILEQDKLRRQYQTELDSVLSQIKSKSKEIGQYMKSGEGAKAESAKELVSELKKRSKDIEALMEASSQKQNNLLVLLPNLPCSLVPEGKSAEDNVVVRKGGEIPALPEDALPHWELARKYDLIDFDLGNKLTGSGFPVYKGKGAKLQRALIQYFLDFNTAAGYLEIEPPIVVNEASGFATGQGLDRHAGWLVEGQKGGIFEDNREGS